MTDARWRLVARQAPGEIVLVDLDASGAEHRRHVIVGTELTRWVRDSPPGLRWVWNDTAAWYPTLLADGVEIERCHDLRLSHAILRTSALVTDPTEIRAATAWSAAAAPAGGDALFDLLDDRERLPEDIEEVRAEFDRQRRALDTATQPDRLRLLLAAESAGALLATELHAAGLPWHRPTHEALLEDLLGPRPAPGTLPREAQRLADEVRAALGDPHVSLDSQPKLLRALHRAGIGAQTTNRWELAQYNHPAIPPLLAYKKLTRLLTANGWTWLDEWAADGRFRPVYVPGGVVTGRWASSGGGALQLPRLLRPAVRADPGWVFVVADVAQLEPRVLAAMARDTSLANAARGTDLYAGIVAGGVVTTRQEAKIAVLGAMYGATTGDSGRLVPALRRAYPRAMGLVDDAARAGERGEAVTTWLGRTSPGPSERWRDAQANASDPEAPANAAEVARRSARDRGRFTRNFVVQGTAAEWALCWLADLRMRLRVFPRTASGAPASGPVFGQRAHLAFFLHDEIIVHCPERDADAVSEAVRDSAAAAGELLFGAFPIDFALDLRISIDAAKS